MLDQPLSTTDVTDASLTAPKPVALPPPSNSSQPNTECHPSPHEPLPWTRQPSSLMLYNIPNLLDHSTSLNQISKLSANLPIYSNNRHKRPLCHLRGWLHLRRLLPQLHGWHHRLQQSLLHLRGWYRYNQHKCPLLPLHQVHHHEPLNHSPISSHLCARTARLPTSRHNLHCTDTIPDNAHISSTISVPPPKKPQLYTSVPPTGQPEPFELS